MKRQSLEEAGRTIAVEENWETRNVLFREDGFIAKQIIDEVEKEASYRLRHRIFCGELKWILNSPNGMEIDEYDRSAVYFGVFDEGGGLLAFLRLILPDQQFMMEKAFLSLVDPMHHIRKAADTAEISRLCVAPEARNRYHEGNFDVHKISLVCLKLCIDGAKSTACGICTQSLSLKFIGSIV